MSLDGAAVIAQLRLSHDRLVRELEVGGEAMLTEPSACTEWSVGRVVSHLGSGAEIATVTLEAGLAGDQHGASQEAMHEVWQLYDTLDDRAATTRSISANATLIDAFESLTPNELESLVVPFFTGPTPVSVFAGFRLAEHVVHTWDVVVVRDPAAELATDAAHIIVDAVVVPMVGRLSSDPVPGQPSVAVHLGDTDRQLVLEVEPTMSLRVLRPGDEPDARLDMSTAAFVRLVYGRLGPGRTPDSVVASDPALLDRLRRMFPGF